MTLRDERIAKLGRRVRLMSPPGALAEAWLGLPGMRALHDGYLSQIAERRAIRRRRLRRRSRRKADAERRRFEAQRRREEAEFKAKLTRESQAELTAFLASGQRLAHSSRQTSGELDISVVIVVWNQPHLVLRCLQAVLGEQASSFEVVLVDNASGAETQRLLDCCDGAVVIRNDANLGFLKACNQGVAAARGRAVLLLNSDAFVRPGAFANALAVLDANAEVGAVGGKLILPSGKLQEAGSIVWSDGRTTGYGRDFDPADPRVATPRDVDYCSGAFLMTRRSLWDQLGGFDEIFAPAYFEEVDLCMRLWAAGYRVVYEPTVVVDHYEFGSEAKAGDAIAMSDRNLELFRKRYATVLASQYERTRGADAVAREHRF